MPLTNQVKCIGYAVFQPAVHINLGTLSSTIRDSLFRMQLTLWLRGWGEASWLCFGQQHCSFCRECGLLFDNFLVLLKSILQRWFSTFNTSLLVQGISLHDVNVLSPQRDKYDFRGPISTIWIFHLYFKLKLKSLSFKNTRMSEFRPRSKSQHCGLHHCRLC